MYNKLKDFFVDLELIGSGWANGDNKCVSVSDDFIVYSGGIRITKEKNPPMKRGQNI